jgi:hypothetical protein
MSTATKQSRLTPKQRRLSTLRAAVAKAEKAYEVAVQRRNAALTELTELRESLRRISRLAKEEEEAARLVAAVRG